jgi:hypothetical protein
MLCSCHCQHAQSNNATPPNWGTTIATTLGVSRASIYRHLTRSRADQVTAAEAVASAV